MSIVEAAPGCIRIPFTILIDKAEKAPFDFHGIRARSFVDPEMREYVPCTERRYLGVGMGDYSIDGFPGRVGIERKSPEDFCGTLLGWERAIDTAADRAEWDTRNSVDRRKRFKNELTKLSGMECKAIVIEAEMGQIIENLPQWGVRSAAENAKYLYATYLAWAQEFPVPWIFCPDKQVAAITTFRVLEKFWSRHKKEHTAQRKRMLAGQYDLFSTNPLEIGETVNGNT